MEKLVDQAIEEAKIEEEPEAGEEESGGDEEAGGEEESGGDEEAGGEEESGGDEAGGEEEAEDLFAGDDVEKKEPETELLMAGEDDFDLIPQLFEKDKLPVKAKSQLKKALYDRSRRKTHQNHMPDFKKMTDFDGDGMGMKDVFGMDYIKSAVSNPFKNESRSRNDTYVRPNLPMTLQSTLQNMSKTLQMTQYKNSSILSENEKLSPQIDENDLLIIDED